MTRWSALITIVVLGLPAMAIAQTTGSPGPTGPPVRAPAPSAPAGSSGPALSATAAAPAATPISVAPSGSSVSVAQSKLSPAAVFDGVAARRTPEGPAEAQSFSVRRWTMTEHRDAKAIPIDSAYLAHLRSGRIKTIVNGTTTVRAPNDLWVVKRGTTMLVQVLGQTAVLDTIVAAAAAPSP